MIDAMGLADPALAEQRVASVFERIHREQMAGLPLLNSALTVATIGFQSFRSRVIGIVSTPWMMSLMMLPGVDDQWQSLGLGEKQSHDFPAGTYRFLVNILDGLGVCQMHSVYSPMRDFPNQASAVAAARAEGRPTVPSRLSEELATNPFLRAGRPEVKRVMAPAPAVDGEVPVDEELLGRILRGEDIPEIDTALASAALEPVSP